MFGTLECVQSQTLWGGSVCDYYLVSPKFSSWNQDVYIGLTVALLQYLPKFSSWNQDVYIGLTESLLDPHELS